MYCILQYLYCDMCEECDGVWKRDMSHERGAECKIGADRDEDGTIDVLCISEGHSAKLRREWGLSRCLTL